MTTQQRRQSMKDSANPFPAYRYHRPAVVPSGEMAYLIAINAAQLEGFNHFAAALSELRLREYPPTNANDDLHN